MIDKKLFLPGLMVLSLSGFFCPVYAAPQSKPESIIQVLVNAANTKNYTLLQDLCSSSSDDLSLSICNVQSATITTKNDFSKTYSTLKINGSVVVEGERATAQIVGVNIYGAQQSVKVEFSKENGFWYLFAWIY